MHSRSEMGFLISYRLRGRLIGSHLSRIRRTDRLSARESKGTWLPRSYKIPPSGAATRKDREQVLRSKNSSAEMKNDRNPF